MTLEQIAKIANDFADENYDSNLIEGFVNEAIARINITLDIQLPFFVEGEVEGVDNYTAVDENWQRMLFVPYATYAIKTNDGSLTEASYALMQRFEQGMRELKRSRSFDIPKKYRLRWVPCLETVYTSAEHTYDYDATDAYEIDPEVLPALGQVVIVGSTETVPVKYSDTVIKVSLAEDQFEYYQLQDIRQAVPVLRKKNIIKDGWWF